MKAITVKNPGAESSLVIDEVETPEPGDHEIRVQVTSTALNRADLLQRRGQYPVPEGAPSILGLEMSGIVDKAGKNVSRWKKGDAVFGLLPGGGYAQYAIIHEEMAMPKPDSLSFTQAAAIPETFLTAYQALCWLGNIGQEEKVLIHAGGSGVGTAAIQIAERHDARIATTAGSDDKLDIAGNLGAQLLINYKKQNFAEVIEEAWGLDCIDLVLDFIGRPYWHPNMKVLARDGRLIYLAFLGGKDVDKVDLSKILFKRLTIKGSTLRNRARSYKIQLTRNFQSFAREDFEQGNLTPVIDSEFDWQDAEKAHQRMQNNENTGKIVLTGIAD